MLKVGIYVDWWIETRYICGLDLFNSLAVTLVPCAVFFLVLYITLLSLLFVRSLSLTTSATSYGPLNVVFSGSPGIGSSMRTVLPFSKCRGVQRAASPWRTLGIGSCRTFCSDFGLIANALPQCSA